MEILWIMNFRKGNETVKDYETLKIVIVALGTTLAGNFKLARFTLVQRKRCRKFKGGYLYLERLDGREVHHVVETPHRANGRGQKATRTIGVRLAGLYDRFFADDALAVNGLHFFEGVENLPMACGQLHRILALVLDGDGVPERIVHFVVFEERALKGCLHRNFNSLCNLCDHLLIGKNTSCEQ